MLIIRQHRIQSRRSVPDIDPNYRSESK